MSVFVFPKEMNNNHKTYNEIISFFDLIDAENCSHDFDYSKISFIQGNLVVLLDLITRYHFEKNGKSYYYDFQPKIKELLERNGYLKREIEMDDNRKTTIAFTRHYFQENDEDLFAEYISNELIKNKRMPILDEALSEKIRESILEVFMNVNQHTPAKFVSTCGQIFPKKNVLIFSIGNLTSSFFDVISSKYPEKDSIECIEWALEYSNTTKSEDEMGGIGLHTLRHFIMNNEGILQIISDTGYYEEIFRDNKRVIKKEKLKSKMPGTIITLIINLDKNFVLG